VGKGGLKCGEKGVRVNGGNKGEGLRVGKRERVKGGIMGKG
jgi:hypothetical protein